MVAVNKSKLSYFTRGQYHGNNGPDDNDTSQGMVFLV